MRNEMLQRQERQTYCKLISCVRTAVACGVRMCDTAKFNEAESLENQGACEALYVRWVLLLLLARAPGNSS